MSTNRQYELVYIVPGETSEDALAGLQTQVEGIVARLSGTIEKTENWGRRNSRWRAIRTKQEHIVKRRNLLVVDFCHRRSRQFLPREPEDHHSHELNVRMFDDARPESHEPTRPAGITANVCKRLR